MSTDETPAAGIDDEREQLPPMPPGWMPATESQVAGIASYIDQHWQPIILDLIELDSAGALGGIRAIITERLAQVRAGDPGQLARSAAVALSRLYTADGGRPGANMPLATCAAMLAAEIDRLEGGPR